MMRWIIWIDERRSGLGVVIVFIVIFLGFSGRVGGHGIGGVLASAGDVVSSKNSENISVITTDVRMKVVSMQCFLQV